jgi:2-polyprenyl-3-methyl-5-hydroxy-6-metoxy-1,4-benzoquinol methylase
MSGDRHYDRANVGLSTGFGLPSHGRVMTAFFRSDYKKLIGSPTGCTWWHSMPLPGGNRINGLNPDTEYQLKKWEALKIPSEGGLAGKRVLDVGANDGFFTLAAFMAGAAAVTAINSADWDAYPTNLRYASKAWGVEPEIVTADFRTHAFAQKFDVIFFLGVLYHLEDVFGAMRLLRNLLAGGGVVYLETQMSKVQCELPIFEYASDTYPTVAKQSKASLDRTGISNYLFPNEPAVHNLAYSYDFECVSLNGPHNRMTQEHPLRGFFKLTRKDAPDPP